MIEDTAMTTTARTFKLHLTKSQHKYLTSDEHYSRVRNYPDGYRYDALKSGTNTINGDTMFSLYHRVSKLYEHSWRHTMPVGAPNTPRARHTLLFLFRQMNDILFR